MLHVACAVSVLTLVGGAPSALATPSADAAVTIGDSYEAGARLGNPIGCARQELNSNKLVAQQLGFRSVNVACAGATVADVSRGRSFERPQLDAITPNAKLVMVSIGGNDAVGPTKLALGCVMLTECNDAHPLVRSAYSGIRGLWNPAIQSGELSTVYAEIKRRAPSAVVLVSGYNVRIDPRTSGETPECAVATNSERALINQIVSDLNQAISQAATHYGFTFVDQVQALVPGTGVCARGGTPGKTVSALWELATGEIPFHPTTVGVHYRANQYLAAYEHQAGD